MTITITSENLLSNFPSEIEKISGIDVRECYQCGKCSAGCPVAFEMDAKPSQIIRFVQLGARKEALTSKTIWLCASCETCTTRCPMNVEIAELMNVLRELSLKEGFATEEEANIVQFGKAFLSSVRKHGRISEMWMVNEYKMNRPGTALQDLKLAPKMLARQKISLFPHNIKGRKVIKRMFKKCKHF